LITLFATLPNIVVSPLAGTLVDRWDRRKVIILSEVGLSLTILTLALLLQLRQLAAWEIYLGTAINSVILAFLRPAYTVITPLLVPFPRSSWAGPPGSARSPSPPGNSSGQS
jgi:MFS transporter, DHA3 family, macrolide efflux protein